jgi:anti-sigma factor ChrR (cupin superfamily)
VSSAQHLVLSLTPPALHERTDFVELRPGVEICELYKDESSGASTALLRYAPGAKVPVHEHGGYEQILILEGSQRDERGEYGPGTLVINAPGTRHSVESPSGCLVLIHWQRPIHFVGEAD